MAGQSQALCQAWAWCVVGGPVHALSKALVPELRPTGPLLNKGLQAGLWVEGQPGSLWRKDLEGEVPVGSRLRVQPHPQDQAGRRASCL